MDVKAIVALALVGLAVFLDIIGLAIPYWWYANQEIRNIKVTYNIGLWTSCGSAPGIPAECNSIIGIQLCGFNLNTVFVLVCVCFYNK